MYDMSIVNRAEGTCEKCRGTGVYAWGAVVNGKATKQGTCYSCRGTGVQDRTQIKRNECYNRHKAARILGCD